jgi:hypothetical protein
MANINEVAISLNGELPLSTIVQVTDRLFVAPAGTNVADDSPFVSNLFSNYNCNKITGMVYSDLAGTVSFECSDDGITWDTITTWPADAATATGFSTDPYGAVMRFSFAPTDGTTSEFRFSAYAIGLRSL